MSTSRGTARHASDLYRRALHAALTLIGSAEAEAHHLHAVEREGEAGETPFIALLGIFLVLLPIFIVVMGLAFTAYYLS